MRHLNAWLWGTVVLLLAAHTGYFFIEQLRPYDTYFADGVSVFENGDVFPEYSRLQFQKDRVYDFQKSSDWSRLFSLGITDHAWGSITLSSISEMHSPVSLQVENDDHELNFNRAYYSEIDTPLTLYRLPTDQETLCIYVSELRKLRCLGLTP